MQDDSLLLLIFGFCGLVALIATWFFLSAEMRSSSLQGATKLWRKSNLAPHLKPDAAAPKQISRDRIIKLRWWTKLLGDELSYSLQTFASALRQNSFFLGLTIVVSVAMVAAMLIFFSKPNLPEYQTQDDIVNPDLMARLRDFDLVPPPSLPPELFSTPEVQAERPEVQFADRKWDKLQPELVQRLLLLYKVMKERGYPMVILEGYRSPERQNQLLSLARTVTKAGAWKSYHQYGLAADSAFMRDGKIVISEKDPWAMEGYKIYGEEAQKLGLGWGGNWSFRDYGHVEFHKAGVVLGVPPTSAME